MAGRQLYMAAVAGVAGITTVSITARVVSEYAPQNPFSLRGDRFDQRTFVGRWFKMLVNMDPATLLASDKAVQDAADILAAYEKDSKGLLAQTQLADKELWYARLLRDAAYGSAPDAEGAELVPRPFRMAGYVPFNGPVCVGMMLASSTPAILFWQWLNQSQNAMVNYFNRNPSAPMSTETIVSSYAGAVTMAMTVAFGLSFIIKKRVDPKRAETLLKFVAFPTAVLASSSNCYIVRRHEITEGWSLQDEHGNEVAGGARSCIAARRGVYETVFSRALLQMPTVLIPVMIASIPVFKRMMGRNPAMTVPFFTFVTMVVFGLGLPATVAVFPQMGEIKVTDLEQELQPLCLDTATGKPLTTVLYNKGL